MQLTRWSLLGIVLSVGCSGLLDEGPGGGSRDRLPRGTSCAAPSPTVRARRLTRVEIAASVEDVLGVDVSAALIVADEEDGGFAANSVTPISERGLDAVLAAAESASNGAVGTSVPGCSDDTCVRDWLGTAGARLARRPLPDDERDDLVARASAWRASHGAERAMQMLVTTMLVSARFLYVIEATTGEPREDGAQRLDGYSLAARLSFLLVGRGPDAQLLDAARTGALDSAEGLAVEAERLAASEASVDHTTSFLAQWLEVSRVHDEARDTGRFPFWTRDVASSMENDARLFLRGVVAEREGVAALLTSDDAYLDDRLGPLYGVADIAAGEVRHVQLPGERHGVLTLPAFLAGHAHSRETSWVHRGLFVRRRLLCQTISPPPPGTDLTSVPQADRVSHPVCGSCHRAMDPIGRAFDRFDAAGLPTGTSPGGEVIDDDPELEGTFASSEELADRLVGSHAVESCFARQAYRFAHRRVEASSDLCTIEGIADRWQAEGGDFRQLLVSVATDESFRWSVAQEVE